MALPNGDLITTVFDPQMAYPVDKRMQVDTLNSRDSISMFIRWEGMTVYVLEDSKIYILQGGRSNEFWKELATGSGTGGTTFVGQFPTADLLPTSGRSAGDYAFVGTGDDFVQYNWDNIANEWVMAEGQTDMASEFFHIGYKTPLRRPVIFPLFPKDVLVETSGDFVFDPETSVARFIFVGEVEAIRGIETAAADREIKLVNRTGSDIPLRDKASGIPSGSGMDFGGTDYTWVNGTEITLKGNGTYWELAPNNQVAFSDHLDSVNAQVSVGSDGLEVITGIYDMYIGEYITFKEISEEPESLDGIVFIQTNGKFYQRVLGDTIDPRIFGVVGDGAEDDSDQIHKCYNISSLLRKTIDQRKLTISISKRIQINSWVTVLGGGIITASPLLSEVIEVNGEFISFEDVDFNFNENNNYGINVKSGSSNITFNRCNVHDLKEISGNGIVTCGIRVESGCADVSINKTIFKNITPIENGIVGDTAGAARAILMGSVSNAIVDDCDFYEIKGFEDGDCIHVQTQISGSSWGVSDANIINNRFHNIYKRAIKFQCSGGRIYNNKITSNTTNSLCTFAAISAFGNNTDIDNNIINLTRATCVFELGSTSDFESLSIRNNECTINSLNIYSSTASTSVLSFIKLNATDGAVAKDIHVKYNKFNGHARSLYVVGASLLEDLYFNDNICKYASIYQGEGSLSGGEIKNNTFIGNGSTSSHGGSDAITLFSPNGVSIKGNVFKFTNGFKVRISGNVGDNLVDVSDNMVISPNNPNNFINTSGITLGLGNVKIKSSQRKRIDEASSVPTVGNWNAGDIVINTNPTTTNNLVGWHCVAGGSPGTWKRIINVDGPFDTLLLERPAPTSGSLIPLIRIQNPDGKSRFIIGKRSEETGVDNTGSNLAVFSYQDNGTTSVEVLSIRRSNGYVGFGVSTPSEKIDLIGNLKVSGIIKIASTWIMSGTGDPEGVIDAPRGSIFLRIDGNLQNQYTYKKTTLQGTLTGWVEIGGATTFPALTDTPANYTGHKNKSVKVNNEETALVFVADGVDVRNITDGGSIAPALTDGFVGSRLNFTSSTAVTLQGFTSTGGQSSLTLVNPHATNNLTLVHNGSGAVKYIDAGATDLVIAPKTAVKVEIVGNEIYRVL